MKPSVPAAIVVALLWSVQAFAQEDLATPVPIGPDGRPMSEASAPPPAPPLPPPPSPAAAAPAPLPGLAPPVVPSHPRVVASDSVASGQGGMSYCGPGGSMSTAPAGAMCSITCPGGGDQQVHCPAGYSAICQCDAAPFASCKPQ